MKNITTMFNEQGNVMASIEGFLPVHKGMKITIRDGNGVFEAIDFEYYLDHDSEKSELRIIVKEQQESKWKKIPFKAV